MALKNIDNFTVDEFRSFFTSFDYVISDCDEVLWSGRYLLPGSKEALNRLKANGKKVFYVSNNSTVTRNELTRKMKGIGYYVSVEDVVTSSYAAALYTKELDLPFGSKAYLIGSLGLSKEFDMLGLKHIGLGPDILKTDVLAFASNLNLDPYVRVVVVGFDSDFSVPKLIKASTYLKNPNVHFVATNPDLRSKVNNIVVPGAGTIVHAVKTSSGRAPVIVGKPEEYMGRIVLRKWRVKPERTLMIGDSCHTDIKFGKSCGFQTLLVLTGVSGLPEVTKWKNENSEDKRKMVPDYYINKLGDLSKWLM